MERCNSIYCVQTRPVSSCHTLLISRYTSAIHGPFRSDSFSAWQSRGQAAAAATGVPRGRGRRLKSGGTPFWQDVTPGPAAWHVWLRPASPRLSYLCPLNLDLRLESITQPYSCTRTHSFLVVFVLFQGQGTTWSGTWSWMDGWMNWV